MVWFMWCALHWFRIQWKQFCLYGSGTSSGGGILLVTLVGVMARSFSFNHAAQLVVRFQFLGQMVESVEAGICLFSLR